MIEEANVIHFKEDKILYNGERMNVTLIQKQLEQKEGLKKNIKLIFDDESSQ